jgi:hypothetical protein
MSTPTELNSCLHHIEVRHVQQLWGVIGRKLGRAEKQNLHLFVVLLVLVSAISIAFWHAVAVDTALTVASQVDYENALLCTKFGFVAGTLKHESCKLDLFDLRRSHEKLLASTTFP